MFSTVSRFGTGVQLSSSVSTETITVTGSVTRSLLTINGGIRHSLRGAVRVGAVDNHRRASVLHRHLPATPTDTRKSAVGCHGPKACPCVSYLQRIILRRRSIFLMSRSSVARSFRAHRALFAGLAAGL